MQTNSALITVHRPTRSSIAQTAATALLSLVLLACTAPAFADTVTAQWNANPEANIAGYYLSYGTQSGSYTTNIDVGNVTSYQLTLNPGQYYFAVRARNTSGEVGPYSSEVVYTVGALPAPVITSLSPTSGAVGATVTITGTNFGSTQGSSIVTFNNNVNASVTSWSNASIVVSVPGGTTSGNVTVTVSGVASNGASFTVVPAAAITSLSPTTGAVGATVTISGTNFGSTQGSSTVTFSNGVTATPTAWSATSIVTTVPAGAVTGPVTVTRGGVASNGATFTLVPAAVITSLSPTTGAVGTAVTIAGTNFGSTKGTSSVRFGSVTATTTSWSATSIAATVPPGAITGPVTVTRGGVPSNGVTFTVPGTQALAITSLSPSSGPVGTTVTIAGAGFGSTQGASTVRFNGVTATATSWSATSIETTVPNGASSGNVVVTVGGVASNGSTFTVAALPTMTLDRSSLNFGAVNAGTSFTFQTPAQIVNIVQAGASNTVSWTATSNAPWLTVSPSSGSGPGPVSIGVQHVSNLPPAGSPSVTGAITVTYTGAATAASTVAVRLNLPSVTTAPTGLIDTPADGVTGQQGSIPVTGWSVDDIAVDRVELWRDLQPGEPTTPFAGAPSDPRTGKTFIGTATFVTDARPDIEGLFSTTPLNYRGGWGYLMLTWGLWNQGNGTYRIRAIAFDSDGHATLLGTTTMGIANASATSPFGSIDTPTIGGTASGTALNFGWALTPNSGGTACRVPASGVKVSIDSGPLQPVVFGDVRADVAALFSGFTNSAAAGGHATLDTMALTNGVHTIAWLITDDCNRAAGVGSRFFTVQNSTVAAAGMATAVARTAGLRARTESAEPVVASRGFGELGVTVYPDESGRRAISIAAGERIEVRLPSGYDEAWQAVLGEQRALPIGAAWDVGSRTFAWQPGPGFLGEYEIVFVRGTEIIRIFISVS